MELGAPCQGQRSVWPTACRLTSHAKPDRNAVPAASLRLQYTSEIFLGGRNTIVMHNTCEVRGLRAVVTRREGGGGCIVQYVKHNPDQQYTSWPPALWCYGLLSRCLWLMVCAACCQPSIPHPTGLAAGCPHRHGRNDAQS